MSKIRRTNQGGSTVLFIIVGIILTLCLVGGVYLVKQRGDQARRDQAIAIINQQIAAENAKTTDTATVAITNSGDNPTNPVATTDTATTTNKKDDLPVTGPGSSIIEIVGIGSMTAFAVSYFRSRRTLSRYL